MRLLLLFLAAPAAILACGSPREPRGHARPPVQVAATPAVHAPTPAPPSAEFPADCPSILRVGGEVTEPVEISRVQPQYPETQGHRFSSTVFIVEAVIDRNGVVQRPRFLRGPEITPPLPSFGAAILDAVAAWRFKPATLRGRPVCVYLTVTVCVDFR